MKAFCERYPRCGSLMWSTKVMNDNNNIEFATDVQNTIDIVTAIKKLDAPIHTIDCAAHNALNIPSSAPP